MTITFKSISLKITQADMQSIHDRLYSSSSEYAEKIDAINNAGHSVDVVILNGIEVLDPTPQSPLRNDLYAITDLTNSTLSTVLISEQFLQEVDYITDREAGSYADQTLERVFAHEIAGHAWQQSQNFSSVGDDAELQAVGIENDVMEIFGEVSRDGYENSTILTDPSQISSYDDEGNRIPIPNSGPNDAPPVPPVDGSFPFLPVDPTSNPPPKSPLVLDTDFSGTIELTTLGDVGTYFDLDADGQAELTAWATGGDGLLARDLNVNGRIDNITELFGSDDEGGFAILRDLDSNTDGKITSADTDWSDLAVWIDGNTDGITQGGELHTLDSLNITSIALDATLLQGEFINGSQITHESNFTTSDGASHKIVDAWFDHSPGITRNVEEYDFDMRAAFLPTLRGFGTHLARMSIMIRKNLSVDIKNCFCRAESDKFYFHFGRLPILR